MIEISVCICTRNPQNEILLEVLSGLNNQTLEKNIWEIIIVDNVSNHSIKEYYESFLSWHPHTKWFVEQKVGFAYTRKRAIIESQGRIIVWVDDDCILSPEYLSQVTELFQKYSEVGIFTGSVEYLSQSGSNKFAKALYEGMNTGALFSGLFRSNEGRRVTQATRGGPGMAMRKEVAQSYLEDFKYYDELSLKLRSKGLPPLSYEDIDFDLTAVRLGYELGRSGALKLIHKASREDLTVSKMTRRAINLGFNSELFELRWGWHPLCKNNFRNIYRLFQNSGFPREPLSGWVVQVLIHSGILWAQLALKNEKEIYACLIKYNKLLTIQITQQS